MSTEFVSLNEVFLPVTGGDIEGGLDVNGLLTVNDKSGNGTVYDVADEIAELKSACDSVSPLFNDGVFTSQAITVYPKEALSLGTDYTQIVMDDCFAESGNMLQLKDGGVLCHKDGYVMVSSCIRFTSLTDLDAVHTRIYRDGVGVLSNINTLASGTIASVSMPPIVLKVSANQVISIYACNATAARGIVQASMRNFLTVQYVE